MAVFTLSETDQSELEEFIRSTSTLKVYRRAKVILYKSYGYSADEIELHTEYPERSQWYWIARYREEGLAGLYDRPRIGRPPHISDEDPCNASDESTDPSDDSAPVSSLNDCERETLKEMHVNHAKSYMRDRAHMILLRDAGYSAGEVAKIVGWSSDTVRRTLVNYDRYGLAGLYRQPGSGRKPFLSLRAWIKIMEWVRKGPQKLGYRFAKWTTRSLKAYIYKRFNIAFSREWIRQKLHELGFSWTRAKKVYAYPDDEERNEERKQFSQEMLQLLAQAYGGELMLLFQDESIFTLFGEVGYSWSPLGLTQEVPALGSRKRVIVFGAADPVTGKTHYRIDKTIDQQSTLKFFKQLIRYYQNHDPGKPIVIITDRHPGHTANSLQEFIEQYDHVTLKYIPKRSPDLNPIEHLWDWLSDQMIKNAFFENQAQLKGAIRHFFSYIAGIKEQVISWLGDMQKLYSEIAQI